ncbi:MAG TPA: pilus assembly PilX N-terminal domain-containing protein, partial [Thermodesulfobacteriota bacterium]|nr:pilus assembly PilX N-terminal domain-containing protein [Thermodesulfobacteriota bacterium]
MNPHKKDSEKEKGAALITVLLVMLGLTIIGTAAFLVSGADLKIIGYYRDSQQVLYAAEAGVQILLAGFRGHPELFLLKKTGSEIPLPFTEPAQANWKQFRVWVESLRYDPGAVPSFVELTLQASDPLNQTSARIKATLLGVFSGGAQEATPPFQVGLLTAGSLHLGGALQLQTHIHANQGFKLDPALVDGLRDQQFNVSQSADPFRADYREAWEVPVLQPAD